MLPTLRSVPVTRGRALLILNIDEPSCSVRGYSGRCDVTWAARVRSSWAKRSDGSSSKRAVTHMQRELNRRGWPQGEKAIERLNGKKRQHPTNRTTQQKLTQQHFLRFVFICHFETTQVSRIQEFSVFKLSFAVLDFFILPLFSAGNIRLICCIFSPRWTLFWTFVCVF